MIVEDCEMMRKFLQLYCSKLGRISTYIDAHQAKEALTINNIPDLIILDLNLPGFSGKDFIKMLNNKGLSNKIPILILSGNSNVETKIECLSLGASDFLSKPFHPNELQLRIRRLIGSRILANEG
jgi:two-component system response regulator QseB